MSVLLRKVLRDVWHMKGQCFAVGVLIALGVGTFVGSASVQRSLTYSRDSYYAEYGLGDLFASVARAPSTLGDKLRGIDGVESVETRLAASGQLKLDGVDAPVSARLVGLPETGQPTLGRVHIRRGRLPERGNTPEVVVSEALANAQRLRPGQRLGAVVDGRRFEFVISGIGLSPEHVYEVRVGDMYPDNSRFGILWVRQSVLEEALGMRGAFNEVVLSLSRGASEAGAIAALDSQLEPYGGLGGYGRERHMSARFIADELKQLEATAFFVPSLFLGVAIFLLNIIVGRVIATQRAQIATLKALGHRNTTIAVHYLQFTTIVVVFGAVLGWGIGYGLGIGMLGMYADYYRFARIDYYLSMREMVVGILLALTGGCLATLGAVRRAVRLQPAEAMQPAAPAIYHRAFVERLGLEQVLSPPARMVLRNLSRRPLRALASCIGVSFGVALLVAGMFFGDAMEVIVDTQFRRAQRQDLTVTFNQAVSRDTVYELGRMPGVLLVEPQRAVAATLRNGHRSYRTVIGGLDPGGHLQRVLDAAGSVVEVPEHGIMLSETLAKNIGATIGSEIQVELLEGRRNTQTAVVTAIADEPFGTSAYASIDTANALAGSGPQVSSALLRIDRTYESRINAYLQSLPSVMAVTSRRLVLATFQRVTKEVMLVFAAALSLLAGAMAVGIVYNAARISLSERERELATMRVIGLTQREVFFVLFGELIVLVVCALPLGSALGYALATATATAASTEMYRVPIVIFPSTYLFAIAVVLASTVLAAWVVRLRLARLDMVSVLKTKE